MRSPVAGQSPKDLQNVNVVSVATLIPLWESFLSYRTLTPIFCLVRKREMRTLSFVFYHQALQADLRIRSA